MRLFVAAVPPAAVLADLDRALPRELPGGPRWVAAARRHVTLAFLGDVPDQRLGKLTTALGGVAAGAGLGLRLAGAGTFPPRGRPAVLWVGLESTVDGAVERLGAAAAAFARAARSAGVPVQRRPFRAHLTVGRWRPGDGYDRGVVDALRPYRGPAFELDGYVLVRSVLGPSPTYDTLASWPVGG